MLVSTVLFFLGVPLWLIVGMLLLAWWNRRKVKSQPGIFQVKTRLEASADLEKEPKWPRMSNYAQWVHDVLIVRKGMGLMIAVPYGVTAVEGPVPEANVGEVKGMGDRPFVTSLRLDDDSILQVALREEDVDLAQHTFDLREAPIPNVAAPD